MTLVLMYQPGHTIYKHPETKEECHAMSQMMYHFHDIGDVNGLFTKAMQMIPGIVVGEHDNPWQLKYELEALKNMTKEEIMDKLPKQKDREEYDRLVKKK